MTDHKDIKEKRLLTDTQEKIKEILLMEISSEKTDLPGKEGGKIISPQRYGSDKSHRRGKDPDMSDLAVAYYEILYKDILPGEGKILGKDTLFSDEAFAGDTMFTFRKLKKSLLAAHKGDKAAIERIETGMERLNGSYHCLANFWLIPKAHGRGLMKAGSFDSPDIYLEKVKENHATYKEQFPSYYGAYTLETIKSCHHFKASETRIRLIRERDERIIEEYLDAIDKRAEEIAISHEKELADLFKRYGLM